MRGFMFKRVIGLFLCAVAGLCGAAKEDTRIQKLAGECRAFGFSLYGELSKGDANNLVFSPYSTFSCLSMVALGARADTEIELRKALQLSTSRAALPKAAARMAQYLHAPGEKSYTFATANGLWLDKDTFVLADYVHSAEEGYGAQVQSLDFSNTEESVSIINEWTLNETNGTIPRLLEQEDVDSSTKILLTNAIYFQGSFQKPFDPKKTAEGAFHGTSQSPVQMMKQIGTFPYFENETFQLLALPFSNQTEKTKLACLIFLPKEDVAIRDLENALTTTYPLALDSLKQEGVDIQVPKFCIETRFNLNESLQKMGVQKAFTNRADFSGIDGMQDLSLTKVIHEALFSFYETGVTASAATAAAIGIMSAAPPQNPHPFIADHPFIFMLVDLNTKLPLFFGKIQDAQLINACE